MLLSVIIPVYGQWQLTKQCLQSLKQSTPIPIEVLLIDNGAVALPEDKTSEEAPAFGKSLFGDNFIYLPQEQNINFAAACNLGAIKASSPLLFFLNNDTYVLSNYLPPLLEALQQDNSRKVVAPLLVYPASEQNSFTVQHLGVLFNPLRKVAHLYEHFPATHRVVKRQRTLQCITGAAFVISKELFFKVGAFNPAFRNGFEDVELCGKLLLEKVELEVIPSSMIVHLCSQSIGRHDATVYNSGILRESKAYTVFKPDWHVLLENDGYVLHLNKWLQFIPYLNPEYEKSFSPLLEKNDIDKIKEQYIKEPYWYAGLNALVNHYQQENDRTKASEYLQESMKFANRLPDYVRMLELSMTQENAPLFANIFETYLNIQERLKDRLTQLNELSLLLKDCSQSLYTDAQKHIVSHNDFMQNTFLAMQERITMLKHHFKI